VRLETFKQRLHRALYVKNQWISELNSGVYHGQPKQLVRLHFIQSQWLQGRVLRVSVICFQTLCDLYLAVIVFGHGRL
jgi:hypothetical protein